MTRCGGVTPKPSPSSDPYTQPHRTATHPWGGGARVPTQGWAVTTPSSFSPLQLPNFFLKIPDYGLYSPDVEFINHLLHLHTR